MKTTININKLLICVELFIIIPFAGLSTIGLLSKVSTVMLLMAFLYESLCFILNITNNPDQHMHVESLLFLMFIVFQSVVSLAFRSNSMIEILKYLLKMTALYMITFRNSDRESLTEYIEAVSNYFFIGLIINFVSIIMFPSGIIQKQVLSGNIHEVYFLSYDNQFGRFIFPGLTIILFASCMRGYYLAFRPLIAFCVVLCTYLLTRSMTGLIVAFVYLFLWLIYISRLNLFRKLLSLNTIVLFSVILSFMLVTGTYLIYLHLPFISNFIQRTGKDITFTGRIEIWTRCIRMFLNKPIFGYGRMPDNIFIWFGTRGYNAHNTFLQLLLESGLVGFAILCVAARKTARLTYCIQNSCPDIKLFYIGLFCTLLYFMFEVGSLENLFLMLFVMIACSYDSLKDGIDIFDETQFRQGELNK